MGRSRKRGPLGQRYKTSSPESKNKYLGERNCTKDLALYNATTSVLNRVGKFPVKSASHPLADNINCVWVPNGVACLHPSSPRTVCLRLCGEVAGRVGVGDGYGAS